MDIWQNFNRHYADLYCFTRRLLCNHENAEDVTQETMLRFARDKAGKLTGESARKWLFVVARNMCVSVIRKETNRNEAALENIPEISSSSPTPSDRALSNERNRIIEQAVATLPFDMREVIILREYEGMNYEEISGIADCPVGTVRSRLARARAELRRLLTPFMEDEL